MTTYQEVLRADYPTTAAMMDAIDEWHRTEPVRRAAANGHAVEWDPPWGLSSAARWSCTACGKAVIKFGHNIYGSATEKTCVAQGEDSQAAHRGRI